MEQLSNANLLEPLANTVNLKNQRMQRTHMKAMNPSNEPPVVENNSNFSGDTQPQMQQTMQPQKPANNWKPEPQQLHVENGGGAEVTKTASDDKILGMPPVLFYGLCAVAAAGIGYLIYKSMSGKKETTLKPIAGGAKTTLPASTGDVLLKKVA